MPINRHRWTKSQGGIPGLSSATGGAAIADNLIIRGDGTTGIQGSYGGAGDTWSISDAGTMAGATNAGGDKVYLTVGAAKNGIRFSSDNGAYWGNATNLNGATLDLGLERTAAGVMKVTDGASGLAFAQQLGDKRNTANQTVTDSATLANSTDLTLTVAAGRHYRFRAQLHFTTINTSGVKVAIAGTATHTNIIYDVIIHGISTPGFLTSGRATAAGTAVGVTASGTAANVVIEGFTTINAGGTLLVQFAQNAETGAAESVILLRGSSFTVTDCA